MARICIGLPVFNGEPFIEHAIDSILEQTYQDLRLVILDNASTDRTPRICRAYAARDPRVEYIRNPRNIGAPANFNKVFTLSDEELFKWAACDDVLAPTYLERCIEILDSRPDVVLCHSEVRIIDESGQLVGDYASPLRRFDSPRPAERFADFVVSRHACFDVFGVVRRAALATTAGLGPYLSSDRVLLGELSLRGRFARVPEPLFFSRDHGGRSVRIPVRQRVREWWSQGGGQKTRFPYWRVLREHMAAVGRCRLAVSDRVACYGVILHWALSHWRHLGSDVRLAARSLTDGARRQADHP